MSKIMWKLNKVTGTNGISTEGEAKSKLGYGGSVDTNKCCTKSRAVTFGADSSKLTSYKDNQLVKYSDLYSERYEYVFSVNVNTYNFPASGGNTGLDKIIITSYKQKYINGSPSGDSERVYFSSKISGDGFTVYNTTINATNNTTEYQRSGIVTFTQNESGKELTVKVTQDRGIKSISYGHDFYPNPVKFLSQDTRISVQCYTLEITSWNGIKTSEKNINTSVNYAILDMSLSQYLSAVKYDNSTININKTKSPSEKITGNLSVSFNDISGNSALLPIELNP